jgi:hypothetical protein
VGIKHTEDGGYEYKIVDVLGCTIALGRHLGIFSAGVLPTRPTEDNSQHVHVHFDQLPYEEKQKLTRLALDTLPGREKPPEIHQGDGRPTGLEDRDGR